MKKNSFYFCISVLAALFLFSCGSDLLEDGLALPDQAEREKNTKSSVVLPWEKTVITNAALEWIEGREGTSMESPGPIDYFEIADESRWDGDVYLQKGTANFYMITGYDWKKYYVQIQTRRFSWMAGDEPGNPWHYIQTPTWDSPASATYEKNYGLLPVTSAERMYNMPAYYFPYNNGYNSNSMQMRLRLIHEDYFQSGPVFNLNLVSEWYVDYYEYFVPNFGGYNKPNYQNFESEPELDETTVRVTGNMVTTADVSSFTYSYEEAVNYSKGIVEKRPFTIDRNGQCKFRISSINREVGGTLVIYGTRTNKYDNSKAYCAKQFTYTGDQQTLEITIDANDFCY